MKQHTPGPWATDIRLAQAMVADAHGNAIADIARHEYSTEEQSYSDDRIAANARLIAAAPDLLSAVDSCLEIMIRAIGERLPINRGTECEETDLQTAIRKAREALRKAKGAE